MASALGGKIMRFVGPLMKQDRIAARNLALAFPDKGKDERDKIRIEMWDNIGRVIAEYSHLHRMSERIEIEGRGYYKDVAISGKPAIFFGGHLANWEVCPISVRMSGLAFHVVYRKPNNPWVDRLLRHARDSGAAGHIVKGHAGARQILSILRQGKVVGLLVDQKQNEGLPIPFFGHDAMTSEAMVHFAMKFRCPVHPVRAVRTQGARFKVTVLPALHIDYTADKAVEAKRVMAEVNAMLESWIREAPAQWLWVHRRWPKETYVPNK